MSKNEQNKKPATEDKPKVNQTEELSVEELEDRIAPTKAFPRK